ncbi:amino acid/polyamine transporter I [Lipomyces japonicus]|uniref:amino acid/polyamine transporter I n=1 Tax=Lipomyces japonicus TaxID=56871 RepID=UPI0034CD455C
MASKEHDQLLFKFNSKSSYDSIEKIKPESIRSRSDHESRQIGIVSAIFLIFNRMVGTGIFATPSTIYKLSGSAGLSLVLWVVGSVIAASGLMVYLEFGTAIPKNGGEKNYLEFVYRKPKFLVTAMFASYTCLLGWAGSNSVVFGQYILNAVNVPIDRFNQRLVGLCCITFAFLIHSTAMKWGLRLQNALGLIKLFIILIIIFSGFAALAGHINIDQQPDTLQRGFEGTTGSAYSVVTALYNVIWSFIGYSNANYALGETKNPERTLRIAAPTALGLVSAFYILINIAYFAAVPGEEMANSGTIIAAKYFRNVFGLSAERVLSVFIALSALGNVMAVIFTHGRVVQELAKEGIIPFSSLFASNLPFNAPFMGLFEHWLMAIIIMLAPPPGDAYNFIVNLIAYPLSVVNMFVALGLIYIYIHGNEFEWQPKIRASLPVAVFFCASNLYLIAAPFVSPDSSNQNVYQSLPYYLHAIVGIGIFALGAVYWFIWCIVLPHLGGYILERRQVIGSDGHVRNQFFRKQVKAG